MITQKEKAMRYDDMEKRISKKGGFLVDRAAHTVMEFLPTAVTQEFGKYTVFYHESGLYSVRNMDNGAITLVYAESPMRAIQKVVKGR